MVRYGDVYPRRGGTDKEQRQCDTVLNDCLNPSSVDAENSIVVAESARAHSYPSVGLKQIQIQQV